MSTEQTVSTPQPLLIDFFLPKALLVSRSAVPYGQLLTCPGISGLCVLRAITTTAEVAFPVFAVPLTTQGL